MTEREIEAFLTVVKAGSISRAAEDLYITQPALSRRVHALEEELGYSLMVRQKGRRNIELTAQGRAFIPLAEKWRGIWNDTRELGKLEAGRSFHVASVGSVSTYLLPALLERFMSLNPECPLTFRQCHSYESYEYVDRGEMDLAIISDRMFSRTVDTIPMFKGRMLLLTSSSFPQPPSPSDLDPRKEIRLPWEPEYDHWHDYWFGARVQPRVKLDQMSLMEHFLKEKGSWVIAPEYIGRVLGREKGLFLYELAEGPPDVIIYYLVKKNSRNDFRDRFLEVVREGLGETGGLTLLM